VDADGSVCCSHLDTSWDVAFAAVAGRLRLPAR